MGFKVDILALDMLDSSTTIYLGSNRLRVSFFTNQFVLFHIVAKTGESGRTGHHRHTMVSLAILPVKFLSGR